MVMVPTFEAELTNGYLRARNALELWLVDQSSLATSAFKGAAVDCLCCLCHNGLSLLFRCLLILLHSFYPLHFLVLLGDAF